MMRFVPFLALGVVLGFGTAILLHPPFTLIRHDIVAGAGGNSGDPCLAPDTAKKNPACEGHAHGTGKPSAPRVKPRFKLADPFWDRA